MLLDEPTKLRIFQSILRAGCKQHRTRVVMDNGRMTCEVIAPPVDHKGNHSTHP